MATNVLPCIYYSNGNFFVYNSKDALKLRKKRIVGQLIGCCPKSPHQIITSGFPYLLNHYAIRFILTNKLGTFKKLVDRQNYSLEENNLKFAQQVEQLKKKSEQEFINKRLSELKKRNIEPSPKTIGTHDGTKLKLVISDDINPDFSSYNIIDINPNEVESLLQIKETKSFVFNDLHDKGFYISSGLKFGSDFLAYPGDPIRYHAQYAVRALTSEDGSIDLSKVLYNEINCLNRLCHTANKIMLLAAVFKDVRNHTLKLKYWTLKSSREILEADCDCSSFQLIEPAEYRSDFASTKRQKLSKGNDVEVR